MNKKVPIGRVNLMPDVEEKMKADKKFQTFVQFSLGRYVRADWGNMSPDDKATNDEALKNHGDISAIYRRSLPDGTKERIRIETGIADHMTVISFAGTKKELPENTEKEKENGES